MSENIPTPPGKKPSDPANLFRHLPGWKRLSLFLGIAAPIVGIAFATQRYLVLEPPLVFALLWVVLLVPLLAVCVGVLYLQHRLHLGRREAGGLQAQVDSLSIALKAANAANSLTQNSNISLIAQELNTILGIDYSYCTWLLDNLSTSSQKDIEFEFDKYLGLILTHTARLFSVYTLRECAACVKVVRGERDARQWTEQTWTPGGDKVAYVYTLGRDPTSRYKRSASDQLNGFMYTRNAAFKYLVEERDRDGFYRENDLHNPDDPYFTDNPKWHQLYDATTVALVECPDPSSSVKIMGFLCVDNKGGGFDYDGCKYILKSLASILYYSMGLTFISINELQELNG